MIASKSIYELSPKMRSLFEEMIFSFLGSEEKSKTESVDQKLWLENYEMAREGLDEAAASMTRGRRKKRGAYCRMDLSLMISSIEKWLANCPSGCGCGDRESAYVTKGGYLGAIGGVSRDRYRSGGG